MPLVSDVKKQQIKPDPLDVLHDSCTGIFSKLKTEPRQVPRMRDDAKVFHASAPARNENPPLSQPRGRLVTLRPVSRQPASWSSPTG